MPELRQLDGLLLSSLRGRPRRPRGARGRPPHALLLALALLGASGCGGASSESPTSSAGGGTTADGATAPIPEGATIPPEPAVRLISLGAEPRRVLRFDYPDGASMRLRMEMEMRFATRQGEAPSPTEVAVPTMIVDATAGPYRRYADGSTSFAYGYDAVELQPEEGSASQEAMATIMRPMLEPMTRMRGESAFTPRGRILFVYSDIPEDLDPQMVQSVKSSVQSLTQLMPSLPEEAVGVGAQWSTTSEVRTDAIQLTQEATYTLVAMDGDRLTLETTITQEAPVPQELPSPNPEVKVFLVGYEGSGGGTSTHSLRDPTLRSTSSLTLHMRNVARAAGGEVPVDFDMQLVVRVVADPGAPL